jgi:hypothetical protein
MKANEGKDRVRKMENKERENKREGVKIGWNKRK